MIRRPLLLAALALPLMAFRCNGDERPAVEFPTIPDLPAEVQADCPPAEQITGELGDLAAKDAQMAIEYARCRAKHRSAVGSYEDARDELAQKARAAEKPAQ
jgi:hypothetical protein